MHQKDEQKAIDRVEHVRENFYKMPYAESAKRLGSVFKAMFSMIPSHWSLKMGQSKCLTLKTIKRKFRF